MSRGAQLAVLVVRGYQLLVRPLLPPACRFLPSCSEYAAEAIVKHGAWRGGAKTMWRLVRCQPLCRGGFDPP